MTPSQKVKRSSDNHHRLQGSLSLGQWQLYDAGRSPPAYKDRGENRLTLHRKAYRLGVPTDLIVLEERYCEKGCALANQIHTNWHSMSFFVAN